MPETVYDKLYENGVRISRTERTISDAEIERRDAPTRLKSEYPNLRQWANDAQQVYDDWPTLTNAQKDVRNRDLFRRIGKLLDRFADKLQHEGFDI